jgi:hypothetical protein
METETLKDTQLFPKCVISELPVNRKQSQSLPTSRLPVTNRDKSADSFRLAHHSSRIVRTHRTRTTHLVGSGEYPMSSVVVIRIG